MQRNGNLPSLLETAAGNMNYRGVIMAKEKSDSEEKLSLIRRMKQERRKKNLVIQIFIGTFVLGYAFFLTSNAWYPTSSNMVHATVFNQEAVWNERSIRLLSWDYSEEQRMMEVRIDIKNNSLDGINKYEYQALDRKKGFFEVTPVLEDENYIVLHITDINKRWSEISLRIIMPNSEDSDMMKLYTNSKEVVHVDSIKKKSRNEYQTDRINDRIEYYDRLINELMGENEDYQEDINIAKENIQKLEEGKKFQTDQERKETDQDILGIKNEIESIQTIYDSNLTDIQEYRERIDNAEEELKQYQK